MGVTGIDHVGIAVESLNEAIPFYRDRLGLEYIGTEEVPDQKVRVAMFAAGESRIELLEPTSPDSPIAAALEKRGPGIHHIAYSVDDVRSKVGSLVGMGVRMIDREPREGAGGAMIAFIHPSDSGRVLTELCQHTHSDKDS
ncbi:MAG: methylmalonyl-CoA epimerase [Candidatus Aegiribacteria sp. MLS_C]|nr:MAG: methylmalonyl-CoA epimerase [Candidatus Aegiribacteria sp. MLS_C]